MAKTIVREYPVVCSNCGGTGTVCSYGTTTAFKTCPVCNGTEVITIKETIFEGNENNIINEHYHMAKRTEMEKQIFPREFVIWIGFMSSRLIYREIDNHWLLVKNIDKINDWTSYTLDELYKYWRLEIEPKNKEK